ncbi:MAG: N-acetyltransferase domain-containing protein [Thermoanaerobacterium thermosaccharolyticum]|jgi:RimJ/RimL family protein N-acetyltransferase
MNGDKMNLYLRKATLEDCDLLFNWANDDIVRKNAFNTDTIKFEDHIVWFNNKIHSNNCFIFILCLDKDPIGQIRIDIEEKCGIISYSIDKNYRFNGYGSTLLSMLEDAIIDIHINIVRLIGKVKYDNVASQKAFKKNGYQKILCEKYVLYSKKIKNN